MSGGYEVDLDRLDAKAGEFGGFADRMSGIASRLGQAMAGAEGSWGDDAVGRSFATAHGEPSAAAMRRCAGLVDGLAGVGDKLTKAARAYRAGEEDARVGMDATALDRNDAG